MVQLFESPWVMVIAFGDQQPRQWGFLLDDGITLSVVPCPPPLLAPGRMICLIGRHLLLSTAFLAAGRTGLLPTLL